MFIGIEKIESTFEQKDNKVKINLGDKKEFTMNKDLFELLKTEEEGIGNIEDNINHYFATKFLAELSMYGLKFYHIENVLMKLENLSHNLREQMVARKFDCSGLRDFDIKYLLDDIAIDKPKK